MNAATPTRSGTVGLEIKRETERLVEVPAPAEPEPRHVPEPVPR